MSVKTVFITGASRGVGLEIAKRFASEGYNIAIVSKTVDQDPRLPGTIYTAIEEIKKAGANDAIAIPCDIRDLDALKNAVIEAGEKFEKIDVLFNNASSIYLLPVMELPEKRFDLMHNIIVRANFFLAKYALPYLQKSDHPHIINLAPKPDLQPKWFKGHTAYTLCKFSASMLTIGLAAELAENNISVNAIWPATLLNTAAVQNLLGGAAAVVRSRNPSIVADAAHYLVTHMKNTTGEFFLDEELIAKAGLDISSYSVVAGSDLITDLYVE